MQIQMFERDKEILSGDEKLMRSCQEFEKIPYIKEAMDHCAKELGKLHGNYSLSDEEETQELETYEQRKKKYTLQQKLKEKSQEDMQESSGDCYYFYQSKTGENLYLDPLNMRILK